MKIFYRLLYYKEKYPNLRYIAYSKKCKIKIGLICIQILSNSLISMSVIFTAKKPNISTSYIWLEKYHTNKLK